MIFCPNNGANNKNNQNYSCRIFTDTSTNSLRNTLIYAVESQNDVNMIGNGFGSFDDDNNPILYCKLGYTRSCRLYSSSYLSKLKNSSLIEYR